MRLKVFRRDNFDFLLWLIKEVLIEDVSLQMRADA
jgi:hypothetical protein